MEMQKKKYTWNLSDLCRAVDGQLIGPGLVNQSDVPKISPDQVFTDTRRPIVSGLFVALEGENFDGHHFVGKAIQAGAQACLVHKDVRASLGDFQTSKEGPYIIQVSDTLTALGDLAADYRRNMSARVIGITGSNGKTTCRHIVEQTFISLGLTNTGGTKGNLNNLIGVPLTILSQPKDLDFLVLELGMNVPGEIARLTEIALPDTVVITSVSTSHIGFFSSVEEIARAKLEIITDYGRPIQAWLPAEPPFVQRMAKELRPDLPFFTVPALGGPKENSFTSRLTEIPDSAFIWESAGLKIQLEDLTIQTNLQTVFQANYLLLAFELAGQWVDHWPQNQLKLNFNFPSGRFTISPIEGTSHIIIDDSYNANPASMRAAFQSAREKFPSHQRLAILGKMAELGELSEELHTLTGQYAAENDVRAIWTTGPDEVHGYIDGFTEAGGQGADCVYRADWNQFCEQAARKVAGFDKTDPIVYIVKGSRSARMERIIDILKQGRC